MTDLEVSALYREFSQEVYWAGWMCLDEKRIEGFAAWVKGRAPDLAELEGLELEESEPTPDIAVLRGIIESAA